MKCKKWIGRLRVYASVDAFILRERSRHLGSCLEISRDGPRTGFCMTCSQEKST